MKTAAAFLLLATIASAHAAEFVIGDNIRLEARDAESGPEFADALAYDLTFAIASDCGFPDDFRSGCHKHPISFRRLNSDIPNVAANSLIVVGPDAPKTTFSGWYSVEEGDSFNFSREFDRFDVLRERAVVEPGDDGEFYLGLALDGGFLLNPIHGWARMRSTTEGLELLDNAIFYEHVFVTEALGIVIGSLTSPGDYNANGMLDVADLDLQAAAIQSSENPIEFDLTFDGLVNVDDRIRWVKDLKQSYMGDWNLDGQFGSSDLVDVFSQGKYETQEVATWASGDSDGDGFFGSHDLVLAFESGGYEERPREALNAVPEPASSVTLILGLIGMLVLVTRTCSAKRRLRYAQRCDHRPQFAATQTR